MVEIRLNKDIETYRVGMWLGLNFRELVFAGLTIVVGTCTALGCHFLAGLPIEVGVYLAFPIAAPFGLTGFYKRDGMSFGEKIRAVYETTFFSQYPFEPEDMKGIEKALREGRQEAEATKRAEKKAAKTAPKRAKKKQSEKEGKQK